MSIFKRLARGIIPPYLLLRHQALLQLQQGERELALVELVCDRSAAMVDVGASIGVYTYFAAQQFAHVYAVEPAPVVAAELRRRVPENVTVLPFAASDKNGRYPLYLPKIGAVSIHTRASLEMTANPGWDLDVIEIETKRLDDCGFENVAFLKIDVEGHEHAVLRGAYHLISSCRPTILIESEERHMQGAVKQTTNVLVRLGYRGFFLETDHLKRIELFDPAVHQRPENARQAGQSAGSVYINNFLFIHENRRGLVDNVANKFSLAS